MYSPVVMDHFGNPRNVGVLEPCSAKGVAGNPDSGPFMIIYLKLDRDRIAEVRFQTNGCAAAIAAGSYLTESLRGKSIEVARVVDAEILLDGLGGLPLGKRHCAQTAIAALQDALRRLGGGRA